MPRRDYYAVLGVKRNASTDDIKRAFRVLAMEYHPDRNPDSPEADARFREIAEAYETLSDAGKRARYDRLGPLYRPDGRPPSTDDLNAFVSDALAGLFRRKNKEKGSDLRYTLSIPLEEVGTGADHVIELQRQSTCKRCKGDGAEPEGGRKECETCGGSGKSPTRRLLRTDCPRCDGRGYVILQRCSKCNGDGRVEREERLKVRVPAGVATGQKLKLRNKGDVPRIGGKAGDLFVIIAVDEHPLFRRRGNDLYCEAPVSLTEATLGADIPVPVLDGATRIRIPSGTESGKVFRLAGRGLPAVDGKGQGDLHVRVVIEVPTSLDATQRSAVEALGRSLGDNAYPARKAWTDAVSSRT